MHDVNVSLNAASLLCCIAGEKYLPDVEDEDVDSGEHQQLTNDDSIDQELPASAIEAIDK
jgi:hypothetical protein